MKINTIICSTLGLGLFAVGLSGCCCTKCEHKEGSKAKLEAQAKLTQAEAQKIALERVPGGSIKEGEIEEEKGKVIWSFDIAAPGTKDITEVQVDAMTGQVVDVAKETVAEQEKEKQEDARKAKKEKQEDDEKEEKQYEK